MDLIVLGNGFDIAHDAPCRYCDFYNYLKCENQGGVEFLEAHFPKKKRKQYLLWSDFEEALLHPDPDFLDDLLNGEPKEDTILATIRYLFGSWIRQEVSYAGITKLSENHKFYQHLKADNFFMTFNYTSTLENLYSIYNVLHIHGQALYKGEETSDTIVFGHRTSRTDIPFIKLTEKPTQEVIHNNKGFFERIKKQVDGKIVVMGLCCSKVDWPYIRKINNCLKNHQWWFYYHNLKDKKRINKCIKSVGIDKSNVTLIKDE